jgi:hypothetical protein
MTAAAAAAAIAAQGPPGGNPPEPRPSPMLLPQALVLPRGERRIAIDGSLVDWPELPVIRLDDRRQLSGTANKAWNGPNDLSAQAFLLWDPDALFVGVVVKDEWHRGLDSRSLRVIEIPVCDNVLLTIDPRRDTRGAGDDPGRRDDRDFWLADEAGRQVVQWDRLAGTARVLDTDTARSVAVHDKERGITTYEARIPWREILPAGETAAAGRVLDLQLVVNDFDEGTDPMPQTRIGLTFGISPVVDPGLLGSMMLLADDAPMRGLVPEFPPKPGVKDAPPAGEQQWRQWLRDLPANPPVAFGDGLQVAPVDGVEPAAAVGGERRLALLRELDAACERMPRVDFLELCQRVNRRMSREVGGLHARGVPWLWRNCLEALSKAAEEAVPDGAARLFRLPMGGWLVRSAKRNFAIDPAGSDVPEFLWGGIEFCVLTQPLDMTRRNDQLLVRMYLNEPPRTVLTHIAFHLPIVPMETMPLVEPGGEIPSTSGARIQALGDPPKDNQVAWSCSYRIDVLGGPRLLVVAPNLTAAQVGDEPVDVAIVCPYAPELLAVVQKTRPGIVLIDDSFLPPNHPERRRITLADLHLLQRVLLPARSVLLGPGESWTVARPTAGR